MESHRPTFGSSSFSRSSRSLPGFLFTCKQQLFITLFVFKMLKAAAHYQKYSSMRQQNKLLYQWQVDQQPAKTRYLIQFSKKRHKSM